ncbi:MAG: hypothetical protein F7C82_00750 [Desulfurococcales archaeon]|nr:hypothetical protein [Desulfurococcales archaeon]MCE4628790.1 hypothetical protein [Desulfurococcales archaeon]
MALSNSAWLVVGEAAERYRSLAKKARNPHIAAVLRMAANVLEQAAWELMNNKVTFSTMENLEVMENLLKIKRLPVSPLRQARTMMSRLLMNRLEELSSLTGDAIGLPV